MEYDDNDYQGQNLHLAGEETSKITPVLHPYALPKFDFDDSLQGHLRFDSLVENEVFLGIPSQEDNNWIEDFSRGSSGIEFSSSAAESCPIPRHNNVWSEATSSESVEMLLKSVGQDDMVLGETIIKESDVAEASKQMEPDRKQDDKSNEVKDFTPALPPTNTSESSARLDQSAGSEDHTGYSSRPNEMETATFGSTSDSGEKNISAQTQENQQSDIMCCSDQRTDLVLPVECLSDNKQGDTSVSHIQKENTGTLAGGVELDNQSKIDIIDMGTGSEPPEEVSNEELVTPIKESAASDDKLSGNAGETHGSSLDSEPKISLEIGAVEGCTVEATGTTPGDSLSLPQEGESALPVMESCEKEADSVDLVSSDKHELLVLPEGSDVDQPSQANYPEHEEASVRCDGDEGLNGHVEGITSAAGDDSFLDSERKKDIVRETSCGQSSTLNGGDLLSNNEVSTLFSNPGKPSDGKSNGGDDLGDLIIAPNPVEIVAEEHIVEDSEGVNKATEVMKGPSNGEHVMPALPAESGQIVESMSPIQVQHSGQVIVETESPKQEGDIKPSDNSNTMECEPVRLLDTEKGAGSSVLGEGGKEAERTDDASFDVISTENVQADVITDESTEEGSSPRAPVVGSHATCADKCGMIEIQEDANAVGFKEPPEVAGVCCPIAEKVKEDMRTANQSVPAPVTETLDIVSNGPLAAVDGANQVSAEKMHEGSGNHDSALKDVSSEAANREKSGEAEVGNETSISISAGQVSIGETVTPPQAPPTVSSQSLECGNTDKDGVKVMFVENIPPSDSADVSGHGVSSVSVKSGANEVSSKEDRSFTFDVSPLASLAVGGTDKVWQSFPNIQSSKTSVVGEGTPSTSSRCQKDIKAVLEIPHANPQAPEKEPPSGGPRGASERKTKRASASGRSLKENAKKANHAKETVPISPVSGQMMQFEVSNFDKGASKISGVIPFSTSNLPDLNTSAPPSAMFHQPFTDLQQVQLRAQIFVYGSLIQGAAPDEACMISAFGMSGGGRSIWEPSWRGCLERLHGQKSHISGSETPIQTGSVGKTLEQPSKHGMLQSKAHSSHAGRASSKGISSPAVNPMIPLSSPLWNISNPSDNFPSNSTGRGAGLDYQAISPLHPYQTPPMRNFVGHNTSLPFQGPFPGPWVASPQSSAFDISSRFSVLPITEAVKLTPVKEFSTPISSSSKHVSLGPVTQTTSPGVNTGSSTMLDSRKLTGSQHSTETKSRKRKKLSNTEDVSQIFQTHAQTESLTAPLMSNHLSKKAHTVEDVGHVPLVGPSQPQSSSAPVASGHFSTSVAITTPSILSLRNSSDKFFMAASSTPIDNASSARDPNFEKRVGSLEEYSKVEEARLQAEEAASHAADAIRHCEGVWNQLDKQKSSGLTSYSEAKLASAAVAIAAAASVAKAAAAAAKIASSAAAQAKLMADEVTFPDSASNLGSSNPASILKGGENNGSNVIIVAAREAARQRVKAASSASRHAENLDAIVKAAELAAEAVSQAGKVVTMGDPMSLSKLIEAGPEGFWNVSPRVEIGLRSSNNDIPEQASGLRNGKDLRGARAGEASDLVNLSSVVPDVEFVTRSSPVTSGHENVTRRSGDDSIKEGCLVEVFKYGGSFQGSWFSADVLSTKDGKAFVCYTHLQSGDGTGKLKEWIPLSGEGNLSPIIRAAHPMTVVPFEGARKRRRAAATDYAWSVGDRVDAWVDDSWHESVIVEKNKKDDTMLTVSFSGNGGKSVVRSWHLRPTLVWEDGEWVEFASSRLISSLQGDTPKEKRLKVGSPAIDGKGKGKMSKMLDPEKPGKHEESKSLLLSAGERMFNIGSTRDENKTDATRTMRSGLQKEGSRVIFGVPKPGKKKKFMEVSKHYTSDRISKDTVASDSTKLAQYLMPQGLGSRGWKNSSRTNVKANQASESNPKALKSGKPPTVSSRRLPQKDNSAPDGASSKDNYIQDNISNDENESAQQNPSGIGSFSKVGDVSEGPMFTSQALPADARKKASTSNVKSERLNKGKLAPPGGRSTKINEEKDKVTSDVVEPRRSNRKIQPTSRLLEGLQSQLIITKIPSGSHDKSHRSHSRSTSKGNNNG